MDLFAKCHNDQLVNEAKRAIEAGVYPYFIALDEHEGAVATYQGRKLALELFVHCQVAVEEA